MKRKQIQKNEEEKDNTRDEQWKDRQKEEIRRKRNRRWTAIETSLRSSDDSFASFRDGIEIFGVLFRPGIVWHEEIFVLGTGAGLRGVLFPSLPIDVDKSSHLTYCKKKNKEKTWLLKRNRKGRWLIRTYLYGVKRAFRSFGMFMNFILIFSLLDTTFLSN